MLTSHLHLPSSSFPTSFPNKILHFLFPQPKLHVHSITTLMSLPKLYVIRINHKIHHTVSKQLMASLLGLNIVQSTSFSNICNSCPSIKVQDQVSQSHKTIGKIFLFSFILAGASIPAPASKFTSSFP